MTWLRNQMQQTQAALRQRKASAPHLLPEYHALQAAEREFEAAKSRLLTARKAWRELGR